MPGSSDRFFRTALIAGTALLGLTAVPGGVMLLFGYTPPLDMLRGSAFDTFVVPGLALAVAVGGSAFLALALLVRRHRMGFVASSLAGLVIMCFEFVQVVVIGSPAGPSRVMQVTYFVLGVCLTGLATLAQHLHRRHAD